MQNLPGTLYVLGTILRVEHASTSKRLQIFDLTEEHPRGEEGMFFLNEDSNSGLGKGLRSCISNKIPNDATSSLLRKTTQGKGTENIAEQV